MSNQWFRKPLRIIDRTWIDVKLYGKGGFDPARVAEEKARLGFNAEHFSLCTTGENAHAQLRDVERYVEEAHRRGIRVFVYLNVHWYKKTALQEHPEWFQVDWVGKVIDDVYGNGVMPCVNNAEWRQYTYDVIRGIARAGADGVFLDGPVFHLRGCYCKACKEKFQKRYGVEMPRKGELSDPRHRLLVEFQEDSLAEYLRGAYEAAKEAGGEGFAVYMNGANPAPNWANARNNVKLSRYQDLVGAEGGFEYYNLSLSPYYKCGLTAKLLEAQAPDKPRVVFIAAKHSPWNRETLTPAELKLRCAETLANGANYWIGYAYPDRELDEAIREVNSWVERGEEFLEDTRPYARVGLYWSQSTANFYGGEVPMSDFTGKEIKVSRDYMKSFLGAYETLLETHTPFKLVTGPEQLKGLDLLVLPNVACMSSREAEAVKKFVESGGNVLASHETSLYNEYGERLEDFALGEAMGVKYLGIEDYGRFENYVEVEGEWLPAYTYPVMVEPVTAEPRGRIAGNTRGFYQEIRLTQYPSLTVNRYGKGTFTYFAGDFFANYKRYRFKSYLRLMTKLLDGCSSGLRITMEPDLLVDVTLRSQGDRLLLHLVNFTSGLGRPVRNVAKIRNLKIQLPFPVQEARPIVNLNASVELKQRGEETQVALSELDVYEVLVLGGRG